ncbi:serine/threonine-protein kinase [Mycolicibacterium conceptionense]|uniref:serine/threonine-protein kinase n=1 Tax=Mycolicibacterium conceptionense TaxID=451644 RepID=UPI0006625D1F|nr:serine/threonine-protein kinase [Mycolicibacterium conceptionense]
MTGGIGIGPFQVVRSIGKGAMGEVFEGLTPYGERVAIKVLEAGDTATHERFEREVQILSSLIHPNIVRVIGSGESGGKPWMTMEYVDGIDAQHLVNQHQRLPLPVVADIIAGTAAALDHTWWSQRIAHRDVKPSNILVRLGAGGAIEEVKLADFGIARNVFLPSDLTQTGIALGTWAYVSPEVLQAENLDGTSDLYSLACTAYTLLVSRPPYPTPNIGTVCEAHLTWPIPKVTAARPDLPAALDTVFAKALAKKPRDRYRSCGEFATELQRAARAADPSYAPTVRYQPAARPPRGVPRRGRRATAAVAGAVAAVVALTSGGVYAWNRFGESRAASAATGLERMMPAADAVSSALGFATKALDRVTTYPMAPNRSLPSDCAWYTQFLAPAGSTEYLGQSFQSSEGHRTAEIVLQRFTQPAERYFQAMVPPAQNCASAWVTAAKDGSNRDRGTWSAQEIDNAGTSLRMATVRAPAGVGGEPTTGPTVVLASGTTGEVAVSARLVSGTGVDSADAEHLAKLVQSALERAPGR